jgi:glycosyltransferase involved in cell wall biosynthesis
MYGPVPLSRSDRTRQHFRSRSTRSLQKPATYNDDGKPFVPHTINLISRDNGVGLTTDMELLEAILSSAGFNVERVSHTAPRMRFCDVAIFLELFSPNLIKYTKRSVGVFNLEWFMDGWARYLPQIHQLWAKSHEAVEVYARLGLSSHYTGFASQDVYDPSVLRQRSCLHVRGHSGLKNTEAIIEAWRNHPDLPPLTIVSAAKLHVPEYVKVLPRIPRPELVHAMNENMVHLCPSRSEGWGHYITEALSTGAHVITTDASPMHEHVRPEFGTLLQPSGSHPRWHVCEYDVSSESIADAVRSSIALSDATMAEHSKLAREHLATRNQAFATTIIRLIGEL